jgi:cobalt-zinc-cadmium efflux system outer membrane protein
MMKARWILAWAGIAVCSGCSSTANRHLAHRDSKRLDAAPSVTRIKPVDQDSVESPEDIQPVSHEETLTADTVPLVNELSLSSGIALSLSQNPDLIAVRQAENVSSAALGVAQTYPFNPFVQIQATPYQNAPFGITGTTYHYVLLMQTIQLAHQQQFREEGACATLNSTRWNILQAELQNVAQTERLYFSVLYLRGLLDLAMASHANNQELLRTLEKQLDAGQATAADVVMVRIDTRSTHQQRRLARANAETAVRDLKRQLGMSAEDPASITGDLRSILWRNPASVSLEPKALEIEIPLETATEREKMMVASRAVSRPDIMAAHADVDVARANLNLATAAKTPDLQIGPYYQRTLDGTSFLGFRAQMDIPVINNGRPLERQRAAELAQRLTAWQQAARRAELEAKAAWDRYKLASEAVAEDADFRQSDLPNELQQLETQFVAGEVDIVRVMQARTSIIQNQRIYLDLLNELAQSAANVTATTGRPVEELLQQ